MCTPDWLNKDYIEEGLRGFYKNADLKVSEIQINPALGKGENFGGVLTRVIITFQFRDSLETLTKGLIVKTSFESDDFAKEKMKHYDIFNREMSIYENVLPKLQDLLLEINDRERLFAKAIYIDYKRQALIFEDLSEYGFVMADRLKGLDKQHIEIILRKLAKMHATSAVLNERQNATLEDYDRGFFNRYTNTYSTYFVENLLACARMIGQWPEYAYYSRKLQHLKNHYMNIGLECFRPTPGHVNVLCHGDLWTNNIMFKYDKNTRQPIDVILIDFQYSCWGSPTLDLHHFFNTSLQECIRLEELDVYYIFYHNIFRNILRKLNYQSNSLPSCHKFLMQVEEKRFFAFHSSCIIQPVMLNEDTEDADFNALMSLDERGLRFKNNIYKNKKVQENVKNLLPIFDRKGLLDFNQCS